MNAALPILLEFERRGQQATRGSFRSKVHRRGALALILQQRGLRIEHIELRRCEAPDKENDLTTNTQKKAEASEPAGLLDSHIAGFLAKLRAAGYSERTLKRKQSVATAFIKWSQRKRIRLQELNEQVVAAFLGRSRERRTSRVPIEKSALRLLLDYLRHGAGVPGPLPSPCPSPVDELVCRYVDYLRNDPGLAENSILVYVPFVRDLLRDQVSRAGGLSVKAFDAATIRSFLLNHVSTQPTSRA